MYVFDFSNDPLFKWTERALDLENGGLIGHELRDAAQFYSDFAEQSDSVLLGWGARNTSSLLNMGAGAISPGSYVDAYNQINNNAYTVMLREMEVGGSGLGAAGQGLSSIVGDLTGYNQLLEGSFGVDRQSLTLLNTADRWERGLMGGSQLIGTGAGLAKSWNGAITTKAN